MTTKIIQPKIVGLKELRLNIEKYIRMIQKGNSFLVIRRSTPVFKLEPVDAWGDEGMWETVADFGSHTGGGVPVKGLLKKLHRAR